MEPSDPLLTIGDVATRLGVSKVTASRYVADGRIASIRLGDADTSPIRVTSGALDAFLREARARQVLRRGTPGVSLYEKEIIR